MKRPSYISAIQWRDTDMTYRAAKDFHEPSWTQVISMYWVLDRHNWRDWTPQYAVNELTRCKDIIWG